MARTADTNKTLVVKASELHEHDYIVGRNGEHLIVDKATTVGAMRRIAYWQPGADNGVHTVPVDYPVVVKAEHECDCSGTGRFRWAGRVENGVYIGQEGEHFACAGKGWQDRSDVIRNSTYWNKYARIYA